MVKKTITYTDYNGVERTEDFYFNLTKAECAELQLTTEGGWANHVKTATDAKDEGKIVSFFKELLLKSYGIKSDDGRRFQKSKEISDAFAQTEAYSDLFMELANDDKKAAEFFNGVIPHVEQNKSSVPAPVK